MGSVNIKTQGIRSKDFSAIKEVKQITIFADNNFRDYISVDTFDDQGDALIQMRSGSQLWQGDLTSLHHTLFDNDSWDETHFEITKVICKETDGECHVKKLINIEDSNGYGGLWEFAKRLTDKFEKDYKDIIWDGNYFDTLETFLEENLYK